MHRRKKISHSEYSRESDSQAGVGTLVPGAQSPLTGHEPHPTNRAGERLTRNRGSPNIPTKTEEARSRAIDSDTLRILLLVLGGLLVIGLAAGTVLRKHRQRELVATLAERFGGTVRTNETPNQPSFGLQPRTIGGTGGLPRTRGEFDQAVELPYQGHQVLLVNFSVNRYYVDPHTGRVIHRKGWTNPTKLDANTVKGDIKHSFDSHHRPVKAPTDPRGGRRHMVQLRTPSVPTLCIQRRMRNFRRNTLSSINFVSDEDLVEYSTGMPRFDEQFEVLTAQHDFARAVLGTPLAEQMADDDWFHQRMVVFEGGVLWTQDMGHMPGEKVLHTVDRLIRFAQSVQQDVWQRYQLNA